MSGRRLPITYKPGEPVEITIRCVARCETTVQLQRLGDRIKRSFEVCDDFRTYAAEIRELLKEKAKKLSQKEWHDQQQKVSPGSQHISPIGRKGSRRTGRRHRQTRLIDAD